MRLPLIPPSSFCDFAPETHIKSQATRHDCLPSLLGDGDKLSEKVFGEEIFCTGQTIVVKAGQKYLVPAHRAQCSNQGRTPFICTGILLESPFASVLTVSRGHPSKVLSFALSLSLLVLYIFARYLRKSKVKENTSRLFVFQ